MVTVHVFECAGIIRFIQISKIEENDCKIKKISTSPIVGGVGMPHLPQYNTIGYKSWSKGKMFESCTDFQSISGY